MARKNVFLSAAVFIAFLLLTLPAASQITSDGTPVEIGDTLGLTFIKLMRTGSAMPDPTLLYDPGAETYEVTAAGSDIWDSEDGCAFIYMEVPEASCWSLQLSVDHDFTGSSVASLKYHVYQAASSLPLYVHWKGCARSWLYFPM